MLLPLKMICFFCAIFCALDLRHFFHQNFFFSIEWANQSDCFKKNKRRSKLLFKIFNQSLFPKFSAFFLFTWWRAKKLQFSVRSVAKISLSSCPQKKIQKTSMFWEKHKVNFFSDPCLRKIVLFNYSLQKPKMKKFLNYIILREKIGQLSSFWEDP